MRTLNDLKNTLEKIDGRGYKAYKELQGDYDCQNFILHIDNVQADPFASPSKIRVAVRSQAAGFPQELFNSRIRKVALEDLLTRQVFKAIKKYCAPTDGGKGGILDIDCGDQEILERSSLQISEQQVEARLYLSLPARGRTILGKKARQLLTETLPQVISSSLCYKVLDRRELQEHLLSAEDQEHLRNKLAEKGLVAFVGNGSVLPRESGISDRPMTTGAVTFRSPPELEVSIELPNRGEIKGMGIPEGVNLIVGGGYHGKSTLLHALERGIYNHLPGDGREMVTARKDAFKIQAEDGRSASRVNISPFISDLPGNKNTEDFSTDNASGSTSQAVNIMEAAESGSRLLLVDEDTSATNFMIRDSRMQKLVAKEHEPITPFIDRVEELYRSFGISTVLVMGGSGDYLDVADNIIMMKEYHPYDVTKEGKQIATEEVSRRSKEETTSTLTVPSRKPHLASFRLSPRGKIKSKGLKTLILERNNIDLLQVEQLVDPSQTNTLAEVLRKLAEQDSKSPERTLSELADEILEEIDSRGLNWLSAHYGKHPGRLARPRKQEICAAINRFRKLKIADQDRLS